MPTQDASARAKENATQKASHSDTAPFQLLSESMDSSGNPAPDKTGATEEQHKDPLEDDADLFEAMNADITDFD
jgi:hypothetical protein